MRTVDAPPPHTGRLVGALVAFGSAPSLRGWSRSWWLPSQDRVVEAEPSAWPRRPRHRRLAVVAATALVLGACSSDDGAADQTPTTSADTTTTGAPEPTGPVIAEGEAWIAYQGVELGIKLTRPDGSGSHVILGPPGDQVHFDWSPDGSEIAYVQVSDAGQTVMVTDLQGESPRPLVETLPPELDGLSWDAPAWSRDGSEVAMVGYDGDPQNDLPARSLLVIVNVAGGEIDVAGELVSAEGALHSFPRWAPDGEALVVNVDRFEGEASEFVGSTVDIIRRQGDAWSAPESITEVGPFARVDWHPSEDLIVFGEHDIGAEESTDDPTNLYTVRPDGTELTQVTPFGPGEARATQPTWTYDGRILFTHVTGEDDEIREIAIVDADGSGLEVVVPADEIGDFNRPHPRLRPLESDRS